jgi:hypothetical protein
LLSEELRVVAYYIILGEHEEVNMIMKGKVLSIVVLLLLASSLTMAASASTTKTPFYVKALMTITSAEFHAADNSRLLYKDVIEEGTFIDADGSTLGTVVCEIKEGVSVKTGIATAAGHFVFSYTTGETIEGTLTAKIQMYAPPTMPDLNGKFVGHGAMHVMGDLYLDTIGAVVFDGYSW